MSDAALKWNHSGSRELPIVGSPRWLAMRQGLRLTMMGYVLMALGALGGAMLFSSAIEQITVRPGTEDRASIPFSLALAGCILVGGHLLMLIGHFRCLLTAPQGNSSKELLFASVFCSIAMPLALLFGHLVGGAENYALVARGPRGLAELSLNQVSSVLQLAGLVFGLAGTLLFAGFLRGVRDYLRISTTSLTAFFWYMAFLVGGTVGVFLNAKRITNPDVWYALAFAWVGGFLLHIGVVVATLRGLGRRLNGLVPAETETPAPAQPSGVILLRDGSFFPR
jgi:hypothetical protein